MVTRPDSLYLVLLHIRKAGSSQPKSAARAGETYFKIKLLSPKRVEDNFLEGSSDDRTTDFLLLMKPRIRLIDCPFKARRFWHSERGHPATITGAGTHNLDMDCSDLRPSETSAVSERSQLSPRLKEGTAASSSSSGISAASGMNLGE